MWYDTQRNGVYFSSDCALTFLCLCFPPHFLTELKEQLLARSSRVDDIERLKTEFNDQKREIREQNEAELESLRRFEGTRTHSWCVSSNISCNLYCLPMFQISVDYTCFTWSFFRYFEQRLRVTEENHREEIALLQLRLVEGALEESVLKTSDDRYECPYVRPIHVTNLIQNYFNISAFVLSFSFISQIQAQEGKDDVLSDSGLKLEKHQVCTYYVKKDLLSLHKCVNWSAFAPQMLHSRIMMMSPAHRSFFSKFIFDRKHPTF